MFLRGILLGVLLVFMACNFSLAQVYFDNTLIFGLENIEAGKIDIAEKVLKQNYSRDVFVQELIALIEDYKKGIVQKDVFFTIINAWKSVRNNEYQKAFDIIKPKMDLIFKYNRRFIAIDNILYIKIFEDISLNKIEDALALLNFLSNENVVAMSKRYFLQLIDHYKMEIPLNKQYVITICQGWLKILRDGDIDGGIKIFQSALGLNNAVGIAYNGLGFIYYNMKGERKEAISYYKKTLDREPNNIESLQSLNVIYESLGEDSLSNEYREKFTKSFSEQVNITKNN